MSTRNDVGKKKALVLDPLRGLPATIDLPQDFYFSSIGIRGHSVPVIAIVE
jgi:hypothetical protein